MASREFEPTGIPIWFAVWCLAVAAIWLTPAPLVDRFVVGPMFNRTLEHLKSERITSEIPLESWHVMSVLGMRVFASVFAVLYLVVRALTARWRRPEVAL